MAALAKELFGTMLVGGALLFQLSIAQAQAQSAPWMDGMLTWLEPGNYDTTVLQIGPSQYEIAFGAGCEDFSPEMSVWILAGSGGVAVLKQHGVGHFLDPRYGVGQCNVLIGPPVDE